MAKIIYIECEGKERVVELQSGTTVMQGAVDHNVRGIIGDCGGACSCATCHVYVDEAWLDKLSPKSDAEEELLEAVCEPRANSRLSCQIAVTEQLDGLVLRLPAKQV